MTVDEIIAAGGGPSKIGKALGIYHSSVIRWRERGEIPLERVPEVAAVTGIPKHVIRPDFWDPPSRATESSLAGGEAAP